MVDTASIFMRALTSFLNPTVTLDLGQSIITHFSFKWKFSRLVISSIMHCWHFKYLSVAHCSWEMAEEKCLWIFLFYKQYIRCNCIFVVDFDEQRPRVFTNCLETCDDTQCIIIFANAMLTHVTNNYWNRSLDLKLCLLACKK